MDKSKEGNKILFAVKLNNKKCYWLSLTPQNYQQQFKYFVKATNMNLSQAEQLKRNIQDALMQRVRYTKQLYQQQQIKIKKQLSQWKEGRKQKYQYSEVVEQDINHNVNENKIKSNLKIKQKQQQIDTGIQVQINNFQLQNIQKTNNSPIVKYKDIKQLDKIQQQNIHQKNKTNLNETPKKFQSTKQQQQIFNSPRFNLISSKTDSHDSLINTTIVYSEQQIAPRKQVPIMHEIQNKFDNGSIHKSTQASSPQYINKYSSPKNQQIQLIKQKPLQFTNKKPFFLQNYAIMKQKMNEDSQNQSQLSFEYKPKSNKNSQVFNRLYSAQTTSSKSKHMKQINTKQQMNYTKMIQDLSKKRQPSIQYLQNMSIKTTESYRAKFSPQPNVREQKQLLQYQKSFQQHLKMKQIQKKRKQKIKQEKQIKPKVYKGSRCEANIIRQNFVHQLEQREQKERKLKEKIRSRKKLQTIQVSSKSPLRKSRVCPSCNNSPHQSPQPKIKQKVSKVVIPSPPIKKQNKAYVSNILNQSYKQFVSQIKNFD